MDSTATTTTTATATATSSSLLQKILLPINVRVFFFFPILMRILYFTINAIYQLFGANYKYMDGECLLKMVNETNPIHFQKHPVWKYRSYESSCNTEEYWVTNIIDAKWESTTLQFYMKGCMIIGLLACLYRLPDLKKILPWFLICFVGAECAIITAHYQSDINHRGGATEHHANMDHLMFTKPHFATFGTAVRTIIPHLASIFFASSLSMIKNDDKNNQDKISTNTKGKTFLQHFLNSQNGFLSYLKINLLIHNLWVFCAPVILHKVIHNLGYSPLPSWLEYILRTYDHVEYHHTDTRPISGFCLGSFGTFSVPYDWFLLLHGKLYANGWIQKLTMSEKIADFLFDVLLFYMFFQAMNITNMIMQTIFDSFNSIVERRKRSQGKEHAHAA